MDIYVKFTKTTHQIWSCHVTPASNSENFYFLPNSILNFRKSFQTNFGEIGSRTKKLQAKNKLGGWKRPPPPSAYRVNDLKSIQYGNSQYIKSYGHLSVRC